ncbi:AEC family transporter [Hydrogenovibrio kuenenii]|uniref:AEC family transporter n=1 Tax=Hydrogenovibrio kuenenii TaxID=63658 RepID=UPI0004648872|nr:AEC family transporter [Hydrogenovibrio kuenenii]
MSSLISSISILVILIGLISALRHFGVLRKEDGNLFAHIVTHITLPAVIFDALSHAQQLEWDYILVVIFILLAESLMLMIAWFIGKTLKLADAQLGSLMLVSAFGSSALLGYAIIQEAFPGNADALSEAVVISELGVGIGLFTLGTMVAIYFGKKTSHAFTPLQSLVDFSKSPIFISIVLGLGYWLLGLPTHGAITEPLFDVIHLIAEANTFFVALTVGVLLQFSSLASILGLTLIVIFLKLILSPLLIWLPTLALDLKTWQVQVIILEAAMPSAMLSVVLATKYGCDGVLASRLVFMTTIASIVTTLLMVSWL